MSGRRIRVSQTITVELDVADWARANSGAATPAAVRADVKQVMTGAVRHVIELMLPDDGSGFQVWSADERKGA